MSKAVGNCYEEALELLLKYSDKDNIRLVHGYPRLTGGPDEGKQFGHAWVEFDETFKLTFPITVHLCVDRLNPEEALLKHLYYHVGQINPDECTSYTMKEALANLEQYNHAGPWDEKVSDALFKNKEPKREIHWKR